MATIDKFAITGLDAEDEQAGDSKTSKDDSFQSFSDGLNVVDKFEITANDKDSTKGKETPEAVTVEASLITFLSQWQEKNGLMGSSKTIMRSRTLQELVERLDKCAWKDQIKIRLHRSEYPCEYDQIRHRIHLDLTRNEEEQLVDLVHQLYHSVHRYLGKLYETTPVSLEDFTDTFLWSEAGALLAELNLRKELGLKKTAETCFKLKSDKTGLKNVFIEPILKGGGAPALRRKLESSVARDDFMNKHRTVDVISSTYQIYLENFEKAKVEADNLITGSIKAGLPENKI